MFVAGIYIMLQQLKNIYRKPSVKKVSGVLQDIDLFYNYLYESGHGIDTWYFENVFKENYHLYLQNFRFLDTNTEQYLHQGVMCIILFKCYQITNNDSWPSMNELDKISDSLSNIKSADTITKGVKIRLEKAISLSKQKTRSMNDDEWLRSISWIVKNVVMKNINDKILNQR
jgi:hypothetical protein